VRLLLVLSSKEVDGDEFIGNVALFGYLGHAARTSGYVRPVKLECHDEYGGRLPFGCGLRSLGTPSQRYLYDFICVFSVARTTTTIHSAYLLTILLVDNVSGLGLRQTLTESTERT
jgi:hypothetical protein